MDFNLDDDDTENELTEEEQLALLEQIKEQRELLEMEEVEKQREIDKQRNVSIEFMDKFSMLIRGLRYSQTKQKKLIDRMREMKIALVKQARQLQVASRLRFEDNYTVFNLRKDLEEARMDASIAKQQKKLVMDSSEEMKKEIDRLKKLLKSAGVTTLGTYTKKMNKMEEIGQGENEGMVTASTEAAEPIEHKRTTTTSHKKYCWDNIYDDVVEYSNYIPEEEPKYPNGVKIKERKISPFQQWKIANSFWSPDCPAADNKADKAILSEFYRIEENPEQVGNETYDLVFGKDETAYQRLKDGDALAGEVWERSPPESTIGKNIKGGKFT